MEQFLWSAIVGFIAQVIDGSLGMAYGITSNTFLLSMGIPPVAASASVHTAEIFTSGANGLAHLKMGNVDRGIVKYLIPSGVLGAVFGAYVLTNFPADRIKPFIAIYLFAMGMFLVERALKSKPILVRAFLWVKGALHMRYGKKGWKFFPFGLLGGFLDAVGGGGWGPLLTSTLFFRGMDLRMSIGSVNFAEFFMTLATSVSLLAALHLGYWQAITGLMVGGLLAAPLGPYITKKLPMKPLMLLVGGAIILLSLRTIYSVFT